MPIIKEVEKNLTKGDQLSPTLTRSKTGFTLVETVVAIGVLGVFFVAIALILAQVLQNVGDARIRATALALAQQKMELIRNLPYAQVGTVGGIPQGALLPTEIVSINSQQFTVTTSVVYIDDPYDGVAPVDAVNTDYKRARVVITWSGVYPSRVPVTFVTNIVPKGLESLVGGGTLLIQVFNASGLPISNADIKIDNVNVTPQIHLQTLTSSDGTVILPGAPACVTCYQITVTKTGYSSDKTYTVSEVANPIQPLATVIEGNLSQISFAIDQLTSLNLTSYGSQELGYPLAGNVSFTLRGSKIIGYTTSDEPVYKYQFSTLTNGVGQLNISGMEWDSYTFDFSNSSHDLAGSNPLLPISLSPSIPLSVSFVAVPKTPASILIAVKNASQQLQASSSVEIRRDSPLFIATKSAGATDAADFGQVFFNSLSPDIYNLTVTAPGYQESTSTSSLINSHQETIILNPL